MNETQTTIRVVLLLSLRWYHIVEYVPQKPVLVCANALCGE